MKNLNFIAALSLGFFLLLSSCSHYYYAPNEGSVLALNEQHDLKVSYGNGNSSENSSSESLMLGYSPLPFLGLQGSYFGVNVPVNDEGASGSGHILNGAIGGYYFFPLEKNYDGKERIPNVIGLDRGFLLDLYFGYAEGSVENYYDITNSSQFNFSKKFIQGGVHFQGRVIGFDCVIKGGNLDYNNGVVNGRLTEEHLEEIQSIQRNDTYDFMEATFRVHFGIKHARLFFSSTTFDSSKLNNVKFIKNTNHFGIIIEIDELFRKKNR